MAVWKWAIQTQYLTNLQSQKSKKLSFWWQKGHSNCHIGPNALKLGMQLLKAQKLKVNEYGLKSFPIICFIKKNCQGGLKDPPLWLKGLKINRKQIRQTMVKSQLPPAKRMETQQWGNKEKNLFIGFHQVLNSVEVNATTFGFSAAFNFFIVSSQLLSLFSQFLLFSCKAMLISQSL